MKSLRGLFFLFLLLAVFFSGCASEPAVGILAQVEKSIVIPGDVPENVSKSKIYRSNDYNKIMEAVEVAVRKQGFLFSTRNVYNNTIYTNRMQIENPNLNDVSVDVIKTLARERIEVEYQDKERIIVSCDIDFSEIVSSAFYHGIPYKKTREAMWWQFFKELDEVLSQK